MPNSIRVERTKTGFFVLWIDEVWRGIYSNPFKAMNEAMYMLGCTDMKDEV